MTLNREDYWNSLLYTLNVNFFMFDFSFPDAPAGLTLRDNIYSQSFSMFFCCALCLGCIWVVFVSICNTSLYEYFRIQSFHIIPYHFMSFHVMSYIISSHFPGNDYLATFRSQTNLACC